MLSRFHFKVIIFTIAIATINLWTTTFLLDQISTSTTTKQEKFSSPALRNILQREHQQDREFEDLKTKKTSPLHDQTLFYNNSIHRSWLLQQQDDTTSAENKHPPYMLLLTNFGWNHENQTGIGLQTRRFQLSTRLYEGIINHEYFHPTAWQDLESGKMKINERVRYYVFLDAETCHEKSWPEYGGRLNNLDLSGGRIYSADKSKDLFVRPILRQSKLFTTFHDAKSNNAKYIVFECGCAGPQKHYVHARKVDKGRNQLVLASLSSAKNQLLPSQQDDDGVIGLVPPPTKTCLPSDIRDILQTTHCNSGEKQERPILWSFAGKPRTLARKALISQHNVSQNILAGTDHKVLLKDYFNSSIQLLENTNYSFQQLTLLSNFAATPGGDCLFSYRFSEVISCGAIPIVEDNGWVLPEFLEPLVIRGNYSSTALAVTNNLNNWTLEKLCRRRQELVRIYQKYMHTGEGVIRGILDSLERKRK